MVTCETVGNGEMNGYMLPCEYYQIFTYRVDTYLGRVVP